MNPGFTQVQRRTVADEVRDAIVDQIRSGHLQPGNALPSERELADRLGVGRTSVREATSGLQSLGVLERHGNRIRIVEHLPDMSDGIGTSTIQHIFETRRTIEVVIAELACCRATDAQRHEIDALARRFDAGVGIQEFQTLDRAFHASIADACGNPVLAEVHTKVWVALFQAPGVQTLLSAEVDQVAVDELIASSARSHAAIAHSLVAGVVTDVAAAVTAHLDEVEKRLLQRES